MTQLTVGKEFKLPFSAGGLLIAHRPVEKCLLTLDFRKTRVHFPPAGTATNKMEPNINTDTDKALRVQATGPTPVVHGVI